MLAFPGPDALAEAILRPRAHSTQIGHERLTLEQTGRQKRLKGALSEARWGPECQHTPSLTPSHTRVSAPEGASALENAVGISLSGNHREF